MNRLHLLALLLALALGPSALWAPAARAEDGDDDDNSDDSNDDSGDDSSDDSGGDSSSDDGGDDSSSDDSGDDSSSDDGGGDDGDGGAGDGEDGEDDHDDALRAVTAKDAIPLKQVLQQFARNLDGKVIDVTLIRGIGSLRYRVKFIDPAGRVRRAYFDAVTGALVQ